MNKATTYPKVLTTEQRRIRRWYYLNRALQYYLAGCDHRIWVAYVRQFI